MKLSECSTLPHEQQVETRATEQGSGGNALLHYLRWTPSVVVVAVMAGFSADLALAALRPALSPSSRAIGRSSILLRVAS